MQRVVALANQIGDIYSNSKEYKRYMALYEKLKTDEELMQALLHYRTTKVNNFVTNTMNGIVNEELDQVVFTLHQELLENKDMKEMLTIEEELLKVIANVNKIIGDKCALNIEINH